VPSADLLANIVKASPLVQKSSFISRDTEAVFNSNSDFTSHLDTSEVKPQGSSAGDSQTQSIRDAGQEEQHQNSENSADNKSAPVEKSQAAQNTADGPAASRNDKKSQDSQSAQNAPDDKARQADNKNADNKSSDNSSSNSDTTKSANAAGTVILAQTDAQTAASLQSTTTTVTTAPAQAPSAQSPFLALSVTPLDNASSKTGAASNPNSVAVGSSPALGPVSTPLEQTTSSLLAQAPGVSQGTTQTAFQAAASSDKKITLSNALSAPPSQDQGNTAFSADAQSASQKLADAVKTGDASQQNTIAAAVNADIKTLAEKSGKSEASLSQIDGSPQAGLQVSKTETVQSVLQQQLDIQGSQATQAQNTLQQAQLAPTADSQQIAARASIALARVPFEITIAAHRGEKEFEIRLDPPDLGRVDVSMSVDKSGKVATHLVVERAETLDQLRKDAPNLERALQNSGLKTDSGSLQFSLRDQSGQNFANQQHRDTITRRGTLPIELGDASTMATRTQTRMASLGMGRGSGIDLRI
jgi:hypothetical protein